MYCRYIETNITGTLNLLELCKEFGVKKVLLASTSSIYGENKIPFREDDSGLRMLEVSSIRLKSQRRTTRRLEGCCVGY